MGHITEGRLSAFTHSKVSIHHNCINHEQHLGLQRVHTGNTTLAGLAHCTLLHCTLLHSIQLLGMLGYESCAMHMTMDDTWSMREHCIGHVNRCIDTWSNPLIHPVSACLLAGETVTLVGWVTDLTILAKAFLGSVAIFRI